ncbi:MAG: c-type cytochrome [Flavipsychrobacter sp.]|jgi:mono/diheme cytochrome c family protein|nr:c-type cytochrome [Flavipsychrobacter sp.]
MNKVKSIVAASLVIVSGLASCDSGNTRRTPGHVYAPDMTYSRAYDAYTANPNFADSMTSRLPVEGTIARGHQLPDHLKEGDTNAYKTFTTSLRFNEEEMKEGGRLYNIYCGICHGTALDGQGPLFASGKFASMPANFKDAKYLHMSVGQMYAAIKYGKNMMGSYASQLDQKQRWLVIAHIKKTQAGSGGDAFTFGATATPATDTGAHTGDPMAVKSDTTHVAAPVAVNTAPKPHKAAGHKKPAHRRNRR